MSDAPSLDKHQLQVSVRNLVDFSMRSGDLIFEFTGANRSIEAIRAHQKIQRSRPEGYQAEVAVNRRMETDAFVLTVSGRADGVFDTDGILCVEEIKTTTADLDHISETQHPLHWGQVKCYGAMLGAEKAVSRIALQLTYANLDTGETRIFQQRFDHTVLEDFFGDLIERFLARAAMVVDWGRLRDSSISALTFPFPSYRPGQRELAVAAYRTIRDGGQILIQAATGIGKTMAALFPAVKALTETRTDKIFYLTARTTGRLAAEKAMSELAAAGLCLKSLTLTAKDKICFAKEGECSPDDCDFARGHYDRIHTAVDELFVRPAFTRQAIEETAHAHRVCPFELSLEMALLADCIICDYNYVFDPRVYLRRFFDEDTGRHLFLIDEAHNLVDRSRGMFSAQFSKQTILDVRRMLKTPLPDVYRELGNINRWLLKARQTCDADPPAASAAKTVDRFSGSPGHPSADRKPGAGAFVSLPANLDGMDQLRVEAFPPEGIYPLLRKFMRRTDRWLAKNIQTEFRRPLLELYFEISSFLRIAELYADNFATLYKSDGRNLKLKLYCIDPARHLAEGLRRGSAAVFFSATMSPLSYFRELLGCDESAHYLELPSPFPADHFQVFIADRVSTLYRRREETKEQVVEFLGEFVRRADGNYLLYFPSYQYMQTIYHLFSERFPAIDAIRQTPEMSENDRERFLERFDSENTDTLAGFAVMGGIFGEGIDLVGRRLSGAAVVGVGLPGICLERELIRAHFAENGFDYAYTFPGINRVLQAAGRVIRSEHDRGALLLIDARYATHRYKTLLPSHWRPTRIRSSGFLPGMI
jgi:DNA excision repair protein ERCC-2